jgi:hypothetical protein
MAIYNVGERDIGTVSVILASFGILAANMTDIDAMGIPDAEGDPTTSSDGRKKYRAESHCTTWVSYLRTKPHTGTWPMKEVCWKRTFFLENDPRVVFFLGGERCKPGPNQGVVQLVICKRNKINTGCCGLNNRAICLSARHHHGGGDTKQMGSKRRTWAVSPWEIHFFWLRQLYTNLKWAKPWAKARAGGLQAPEVR